MARSSLSGNVLANARKRGTAKPAKRKNLSTPRALLEFAALYEYEIALLLIILLGFALSVVFFYGPSPINFSDNTFYSQAAYELSTGNWSIFHLNGMLASQYLLIMGIALFYWLFSPSPLSAAAFGIICFLLTVFVVYLIGSELYNRKAGLLSALAYSFNPLAVINASYVGNDGPMIFFVSLAVLSLVLAFKYGSKKGHYYFLSGFLSLIGILFAGRAVYILPFMGLAMLVYLIKEHKLSAVENALGFAGGLAAALLAIMILSAAFGNPPLYVFNINLEATWNFCQTSQVGFYLGSLFPYHIVMGIEGGNAVLTLTNTVSEPSPFLNGVFSSGGGIQSPGIYGYAGIAGAAFLALRRKRAAYLPALWFAATFGWLGFGTLSLTNPLFVCTTGVRFMLIFMPALALLIGFALASFADMPKSKLYRYSALLFVAAAILILFYNSFIIIRYVDLSQYRWVYPLITAGNYIRTLPANTLVRVNLVPLDIAYTGTSVIINGPAPITVCNDIGEAEYVVTELNTTFASMCNLSVAFSQPPIPSYLQNYTLFDNSAFGTYFNETVYYRS